MPAQIVVVKRPRAGLFALVRSVPAWLRAAWQGDALAPPSRSGASRTSPRGLDPIPAPDAPSTPAPAADASTPAAEPPDREARLRAGLRERGATLARSREGMDRIEVPAGEAPTLLRWLREDPSLGFDRLVDLTVVDRLDRGGALEVVYLLASSTSGERLRAHAVLVPESPEIATATLLWPAADWLEREAYDLFGVRFRGHPGLQRILLPPDFEGAPLRKDFVHVPPAAPARPEGGTA